MTDIYRVKCSLEIVVQGYINGTRIVVWKKVCTDEDDLIFKSLDFSWFMEIEDRSGESNFYPYLGGL